MDAEAPLRLVLASCLLSSIESQHDLGRPTLPSFQFFIRSIARAMADDDLWGPDYYATLEPKAFVLQDAIQELMYQCQTIQLRMTPPASPDSVISMDEGGFLTPPLLSVGPGMPVKRSKFAKKQANMLREEAQWLKSVVKNCSHTIDPDAFASPITTEFIRRLSTISVES